MDKQKRLEKMAISQKAIRQSAKNEGAFVDLLNQEMKELQDGQKDLEEMIGIIQNAVGGCAKYWAELIAVNLRKNSYRKIPENAVVLTREDFEKLHALKDDYAKGYEAGVDEGWDNACKETAEKFAERLKAEIADFDELRCIKVFEFIDEICNEIIGEKV